MICDYLFERESGPFKKKNKKETFAWPPEYETVEFSHGTQRQSQNNVLNR